MFLLYIIRFIKGFIRFEISGKNIYKFLNNLVKTDISIWDTSKIKNKIHTNTSIKNYIKLHKLTKGLKIKLKIINRHGLPFIVKKYKNRFGLLFGFIFFTLFLLIMSQFIWNIEIHGSKTINENQLIKFLSNQNIAPGKYRKNINVLPIEREILLNFKNISWISINIQGSKATVEIKERTPPPKTFNEGLPCNIIAAKKGIIKHVEAYSGQNIVEIGDFVEKGQIVVSGIMEDKSQNNTIVNSNAKVIAQIDENIKYSQPLNEKEIIYKKIFTNIYIGIFNTKLPITLTKKTDRNFKNFEYTIYPKIFNISLPFNIHKCENKIPVEVPVTFTPKEAKLRLLKKIKKSELEMKKNNVKIISKKILSQILTDNNYTIDINYSTEQDIAQKQEIILN